jgi:adenylate cyclase
MTHKRLSWHRLQQFPETKLGQWVWEWRGVWITAPAVAGLVLAVRLTGLLQTLEWAALDAFFRHRPLEPRDPAIVIVGIEESDIQAAKQYPLSDALLAQVITKIRQQQPAAIGLDLYRDLPVPPGTADLIRVFETTPNLYGIEKLIDDTGTKQPAIPAAPTLKRLKQVGINDVIADGDGKIRRGILYLPTEDVEGAASLGLKLALRYLEAKGITPDPNAEVLTLGRAAFPIFAANDGGYINADAAGYQTFINFRGPSRSFETLSLMQVLQGQLSPTHFHDRIVLIGPMAPSLRDYFYTPYSGSRITDQTAGVEIQANLASQIINAALSDRPLIQVWSDSIEGIWILFWSFMGALMGWSLRSARWVPLGIALISSGLVSLCFLAFLSGWWIPVVPPLMTLVGSVVVITRYVAELERRERHIVMNLFGRHVTPQVAEAIWRDRDQILKEGRVRGQRITATVLFSDIKGFSHIAEGTDPETLMNWLNEYMEAMAQLVLDHGGIVDKFIGDAVMAVFGAPIPSVTPAEVSRDAQQAVRCATAMGKKLRELNQRWSAQARPEAAIRIGIATGTVVIGSLGSSQRLDYTIIGDSVNIAARLESYDKFMEVGICRILISEGTQQYIRDLYPTCSIGEVALRGREQPVTIYQVLLPGVAIEQAPRPSNL